MSIHDGPVTSPRRPLKAVCFDFRGVILDHKTNEHMVPGMERLLSTLKKNGIRLALISRFPKEVLTEMLGPVQKFFGPHVYSSSEHGKLACIKEFARECDTDDLAQIAFVDDKPDNLLPVARQSPVRSIGFLGSGKYPQARDICFEEGIPYAESVEELEVLLPIPACDINKTTN